MSTHVFGTKRWTTAAAPDTDESLPMELSALGAHANHCNESRGKGFVFLRAADAIHDFVAPRVITTLVVLGFVIGICAIVF